MGSELRQSRDVGLGNPILVSGLELWILQIRSLLGVSHKKMETVGLLSLSSIGRISFTRLLDPCFVGVTRFGTLLLPNP